MGMSLECKKTILQEAALTKWLFLCLIAPSSTCQKNIKNIRKNALYRKSLTLYKLLKYIINLRLFVMKALNFI